VASGLNRHFIEQLRTFTSFEAIGPSALRSQGRAGVLRVAQDHCASLDLRSFGAAANEAKYLEMMDKATKKLEGSLYWGSARKALNLYLRSCLYNHYLRREFRLRQVEPFMEIPLDSIVARGLRRMAGRRILPQWPNLKWLTPEVSKEYQEFAKREARKVGLARVHLDVFIWTEGRVSK